MSCEVHFFFFFSLIKPGIPVHALLEGFFFFFPVCLLDLSRDLVYLRKKNQRNKCRQPIFLFLHISLTDIIGLNIRFS